jgi:two-component system nitrogen regulation sensor histidine kinase NtrY
MPNTVAAERRGRSPTEDRRALFAIHSIVVVSLAWWVRTLAIAPGLAAALGAIVAAAVAWRAGRQWATGALAIIGLAAAALSATYARTHDTIVADAASEATISRRQPYEDALVAAIARTQAALATAADEAAAGRIPANALPSLDGDAGIVVYRAGRPASWVGRIAVPTDGLWEREGFASTALYVAQYAVSVRGDRRAVATHLVHATAPASRLVRTLTNAIGVHGGVTFDVHPIATDHQTDERTAALGGDRIALTAVVPAPAVQLVKAAELARGRGTLLLLATTLVALATLWRRAEGLPERVLAATLPLAALAITPLNALSNVTRLFDPATYYVPIGGPFTASIGALMVTSALVLFVVLAALRGRFRPRPRWVAVLAVVAIAATGPFLLRALARGVALPPRGAGTGLWMSWEVALFLAAATVLTLGISAGQWALGARRGLPIWTAPALAGVSALLGPVLLYDAARWPSWYPLLWITAIAALALTRRSRAIVFPSAFVAACGATVLLWGATLRERVELATADISTVATVDSSTAALLDRFAQEIAIAPVARTREQLLALYGKADLAAIDYPAVLAHWPAGQSTPAAVLSLGGDGRFDDVAVLVELARAIDARVLRPLAPTPIAALAVAVPSGDGTVTTAVVQTRTRLTPVPAFTELLGLETSSQTPPYQLTITGPAAPGDPLHLPWERRGAELHGDWTLVGRAQLLHVHASVPFDAYSALIPRGVLSVLFDMLVVVLLVGLDMLVDGALVRWVRMRRLQWVRSYRLRLTLALFAFFVVPAGGFALWSYGRLRDDDRAARDLLLRETLRRARVAEQAGPAARPARDRVTIEGVPADVPLLLYRDGQLTAATDSLLLAVAPIGRWLPLSVRAALRTGEELVATVTLEAAGRPILFGFRQFAPGSSIVAAAPARRDDAGLDKRRSDLAVLVLLTTVLGALAALWLSGIAARQLARPIGQLRTAALAVASGSRDTIEAEDPPAEFVPVFSAFDRMAHDLATSETQLARAERVFAWGEMARQVAHEIKNPLTPIRLGIQHVLRAWRDHRADFGAILEENSERILREIDHLDSTARSFSRFGTPPGAPATVGVTDVSVVTRDIAALESLAADGIEWESMGAEEPAYVRAHLAELREVLLNICENSRLAGARHVTLVIARDNGAVTLTIADDGEGIDPAARARVFEPHFSTRTAGSGLGLAISRRMVEGWGGRIDLLSEPGVGTTVVLRLVAALPE